MLVFKPDHTRSLPLPFLFRTLVDVLHDVKKIDFLVALGTHPPLSEKKLNKLVGISKDERKSTFSQVGLLNHTWDNPAALASLGVMEQDEIKEIAGERWHPSLPKSIPIQINKAALE